MHSAQEFLRSCWRICLICCLTSTVLPAARKHRAEVAGRVPAIPGCWASPASARKGSCWERAQDPCACWDRKPGSAHRGCCEAPADSQQGKAEPQLSSGFTPVGMQGDRAAKQGESETLPLNPAPNPRGVRKSDFCFSKGCNCLYPRSTLSTSCLLGFFLKKKKKHLILTQDCKYYAATR